MAEVITYPLAAPAEDTRLVGTLMNVPQANGEPSQNLTRNFTVASIATFANSYSLGYTVYSAQLTAGAGAAPTVTVLQNTTGLTFVWTRVGSGQFVATVAGTPFIANKFWAMSSAKVPQLTSIVRTGDNTARLDNVTSSTGAALNDLVEGYIEIRIYNQNMARISSYPFDTNITGDDAWIGTDSGNKTTKQFTASAVARFINLTGKIAIGGQMNFKWSNTQNGGAGTISRTGGNGTGLAFNTITQMRISITETSGENFYIANLTYIGGNGTIAAEDTIYTICHFDITSGGTDVSQTQVFNPASTQWVINNTTGKPDCSVTLVNDQGAGATNEIIFGCVEYTNATTITVDFDIAVAGSSFIN